ncbi:MAG: S26 family signal peptidase [Phycisphaerales bacterium]|nr:S26 family signal peptidase [Phycisphaerales bacterium]
MECPSCTFQNMPGLTSCVRCGTLMDLSGVDVMPVRASSGRAGRRAQAAARSVRQSATDAAHALERRVPLGLTFGDVSAAQLLHCLVPGLPQIRSEFPPLRLLGWAVLGLWLSFLALAGLFVGTTFSTLLCFGLLSIHGFSISLLFTRSLQNVSIGLRFAFGIGVYILLFAVYGPALAGVRSVAVVVPVNNLRVEGAIHNDDILLRTGRWTRPKAFARGDLVVAQIGWRNDGGLIIRGGLNIDRIIGVPGDVVQARDGALVVNDEVAPPDRQPLAGASWLGSGAITVPDSTYLIMPSTLALAPIVNRPDLNGAISLYREDDILGRVILRVRPWSRFGRIDTPAEPTP